MWKLTELRRLFRKSYFIEVFSCKNVWRVKRLCAVFSRLSYGLFLPYPLLWLLFLYLWLLMEGDSSEFVKINFS